MKKIITLFLTLLLVFTLSGCSKSNDSGNNSIYEGKITALSKKYLSKGYAINIYHSNTPLEEDSGTLGKFYIDMNYGIIAEYTSTAIYNPNADYNIKKVIVSNVKVLSTSKMGIVEDLYIMQRYSQYPSDPHVDVVSAKTKYEIINDIPNSSGVQSQVMINLNKIALYDESKSPSASNGRQPTLEDIYGELGITSNEVALKIGFRIELITTSNKVLYKDYEVVVPPTGVDITGSEFHFDYYETDIAKMEYFLEKD